MFRDIEDLEAQYDRDDSMQEPKRKKEKTGSRKRDREKVIAFLLSSRDSYLG